MRSGRWGVLETIGTMLILMIVIAVLWPVTTGHRGPAVKTVCLSNIKQISTGMAIYQTDFDDRFPPKGWIPELVPYLKNTDLETCPVVEKEGKKHGYAMNLAMLGLRIDTITNPAKTLAFFETDALGRGVVTNLAGRNTDRHEGKGSIVGYADTSARFIKKGVQP